MEKKQPLVSVNVLMYNSSKYILETLESIKAQTYQNIELIMSDDKSTDNTVQICEKWIAKNKDRFVSYQILVPDHNTGQSGNYNRAFRAATGEWIKEIDGDDLLLPNCITDLMEFANANPEAKYIFGKMECFGSSKENLERVSKAFDYTFFSKTKEEQLEQLLFKGNCVPSPCSFYNRDYISNLDFECDERIPHIEDGPKWINLIRKKVSFHLLNKLIVSYRVGSGVSTQGHPSVRYYKSLMLFRQYYQYPEWKKKGEDYALEQISKQQIQLYEQFLEIDRVLTKVMNLPPVKLIKKIFY